MLLLTVPHRQHAKSGGVGLLAVVGALCASVVEALGAAMYWSDDVDSPMGRFEYLCWFVWLRFGAGVLIADCLSIGGFDVVGWFVGSCDGKG